MSVFLHRLGGMLGRYAAFVVVAWLLVLGTVVGLSMVLGDDYDDSFSIPGTQSQEGQDIILDRFDQSGTTATVVFTATNGKVTDSANAKAVKQVASAINAVRGVSMSNPLGPPPGQSAPILSSDKTATLGTASFADVDPSEETLDAVLEAGRPTGSARSAITTSVGGDAYNASDPPSRIPELIGLGISFVILAVTFASLVAAGMPILSGLVGVGVTISSLVVISNVVTVNSSSPNLAEMLGLAVGIDYALFLLSRYRRQLADPGIEPVVAMSRAMATAGSAVVFAGTTVIIALTGLAVARIPVLTVMGLAAAAAVAVAVLAALTLVPSIALLLGERLRPRRRTRPDKPAADERPPKKRTKQKRTKEKVLLRARWVHLVTAHPVLTIVPVVGFLLVLAIPALRIELALPDNSTAPVNTPQRQTYDVITETFGEGYNAPLSVTAGVITSSNPTQTVNDLAKGLRQLPGVVAVPQATPNESGDTALLQVIPTAGQNAPSTAELVTELRDNSSALEKKYGVTDILVTGPTATNIDVSDRLAGALLPFAAIVIGLSLLLLMIVFRSVAVPLKATLGYLLSVGAALGVVVAVFQWGWLGIPGLTEGPIVSFLPIFLMGVLFGLAMDYEMFLVSAMREEYVHSGDPRDAIYTGFRASAPVVTAAALIMTSVFTTFVPDGSNTIQPIAFGLAVGVFVDAFVVRMTLVPAVLMLLGHRAWWLPAWLDARIPEVDVEGAAMHRKVEYEDWEKTHGTTALVARDLVVRAGATPVHLEAPPTRVTHLPVPEDVEPVELAQVLVGRQRPSGGELVVGGLLLPEQGGAVQTAAAYVEVGRPGDDERPVSDQVEERARLSVSSRRRRTEFVARGTALAEDLQRSAAVVDGHPGPLGRAATTAAVVEAALAVAGGAGLLVLIEEGPESNVPAGTAEAMAQELSRQGTTAVLLRPDAWRRQRLAAAAGRTAAEQPEEAST
ncbi:MMPL family transporter [Nocardioides guangzhouensis]|nr:MMPL family transporter [Nocardioides guangzhouensis]